MCILENPGKKEYFCKARYPENHWGCPSVYQTFEYCKTKVFSEVPNIRIFEITGKTSIFAKTKFLVPKQGPNISARFPKTGILTSHIRKDKAKKNKALRHKPKPTTTMTKTTQKNRLI